MDIQKTLRGVMEKRARQEVHLEVGMIMKRNNLKMEIISSLRWVTT